MTRFRLLGRCGGRTGDDDTGLDGSFPFLVLAELAAHRARFAFSGSVVEMPQSPAHPSSASTSVPRSGSYMDMTDTIQYWGANIMMDIR